MLVRGRDLRMRKEKRDIAQVQSAERRSRGDTKQWMPGHPPSFGMRWQPESALIKEYMQYLANHEEEISNHP